MIVPIRTHTRYVDIGDEEAILDILIRIDLHLERGEITCSSHGEAYLDWGLNDPGTTSDLEDYLNSRWKVIKRTHFPLLVDDWSLYWDIEILEAELLTHSDLKIRNYAVKRLEAI